MLTRRQSDLLAFIARYQRENGGVSPSFRDMRAAMGHAGGGAIYGLIRSLERRGFIRRIRDRARAIEILDPAAPAPAPRYHSAFCVDPDDPEARDDFYRRLRHLPRPAHMGLDRADLAQELPGVEGEREEGERVPPVLPRQQDAQLGYAVQRGGSGFGLSAIGELIPVHDGEGGCERFAARMEHQGRIPDEA